MLPACALPGDVLLGRAPASSLCSLPRGSSHARHAGFGALLCRGFAPGVLLPGCVSGRKVSDELVKRPRAPGGRRGKQLQKEQIPLVHLMIFICVSVGAGAIARSVALFSEMLCSQPGYVRAQLSRLCRPGLLWACVL